MEALKVPQVYVAHVKVGYEARGAFIERHLRQLGISFQYMLDGDVADLNSERMRPYFSDARVAIGACPENSCAMKHVLIWHDVVARGLSGALVLEDDIELSADFVRVFNRTQAELQAEASLDSQRHLISYENSSLRFIPKRWLRVGRYLYPGLQPRCTAAYYISGQSARDLVAMIEREKIDEAIDSYLLRAFRAKLFPVYWCEPPIAEQGSMNGRFASGICQKRGAGVKRRIGWTLDKVYRRVRWALAGTFGLDRKAW